MSDGMEGREASWTEWLPSSVDDMRRHKDAGDVTLKIAADGTVDPDAPLGEICWDVRCQECGWADIGWVQDDEVRAMSLAEEAASLHRCDNSR